MSDVFRVLHVCTGNICRSPMAERLMRAGLDRRLGAASDRFVIESAGTLGHAAAPMQPHALEMVATYGLDGSDFRARALVAEHVQTAGLVLAATREHRAAAVVLQPRAASRTFTLREFARLTATVDPAELPSGDLVERAHVLVALAASRRGLVRPGDPEDDDLADPYQGPRSAFDECVELIAASLRGPLDLLAPPAVDVTAAESGSTA